MHIVHSEEMYTELTRTRRTIRDLPLPKKRKLKPGRLEELPAAAHK